MQKIEENYQSNSLYESCPTLDVHQKWEEKSLMHTKSPQVVSDRQRALKLPLDLELVWGRFSFPGAGDLWAFEGHLRRISLHIHTLSMTCALLNA